MARPDPYADIDFEEINEQTGLAVDEIKCLKVWFNPLGCPRILLLSFVFFDDFLVFGKVHFRGPTVRGPICHFFRADSWAPDNRAPGPICPGPNLPRTTGPYCPGPNCPRPNLPRTAMSCVPNGHILKANRLAGNAFWPRKNGGKSAENYCKSWTNNECCDKIAYLFRQFGMCAYVILRSKL